MNKLRYIILFWICMIFIPKVNALSYNIDVLNQYTVEVGSKVNINVSINNIKDTSDGVSVCQMNISFDKNIELESCPRTLNSWSMTTGRRYLFDIGNPVKDSSDMFIIPVVVNGEGSIQLTNIVCSDGYEEVEINNKSINFSIKREEVNVEDNTGNSNSSGSDNKTNDEEDNELENQNSNCNLSDIEVSEGIIIIDPNVTEYEITISNFDEFQVYPKLEDEKSASYVIDKIVTSNGGNVVITVNGLNGEQKVYTIYTTVLNNEEVEDVEDNNNYIPIFVGIIVILLLINVIRIIKSNKKSNG